MPVYTFKTESGQTRELFFNMSEAPTIGSTIEFGGVALTRQVDPVQVDCRQEVRFTSHGLPRNHPDAPACNAQGKPVFASKKQVDEFVAKQDGAWLWD
tara:strand:+ start:6619 stop:6912 length:294 start_codon:yes stop_codon:yes gene_type:complete